jgi:hypothetical protein
LDCKYCLNLTYADVSDACKIDYTNSPLVNYNNDLYLSYIYARRIVLSEVMCTSNNYESGVASIVSCYI